MNRVLIISVLCLITAVSAGPRPKITNGDPIEIEEAPYQVWLGNCGGVIISDEWILTAGHCGKPPRVGVGSTKRASLTYYNVADYAIKEDYDENGGFPIHDVAVAKLSKKLTFSDKVNKIEISDTAPGVNKTVRATGWGTTETGDLASSLLALDLFVVSKTECQQRVDQFNVDLEKQCTCVDNKKPDHHIFFGDSGGPLVSDGKLVGVASWINDDYENSNLGGYADLSIYREWIRNQTGV